MKASESKGYTTVICNKPQSIAMCNAIKALKPVPFYYVKRQKGIVLGVTVKLRLDATKALIN